MNTEEIKLLEKVARYYAKGGYKLDEEVTDKEIENVAKLIKNMNIENTFNELVNSYMKIKKKKVKE